MDEEKIAEALVEPAIENAPKVDPFGSVGVSARIVRAIEVFNRLK